MTSIEEDYPNAKDINRSFQNMNSKKPENMQKSSSPASNEMQIKTDIFHLSKFSKWILLFVFVKEAELSPD